LYIISASAESPKEQAYFNAFYNIQKLSTDFTPINPATQTQTKEFLQLMVKNNIKEDMFDPADVTVNADGHFDDEYGSEYTLYLGDFNNCGSLDYMLIATGGSMHVDTIVDAWSKSGAQLAKLSFNHDVIDGVLGGSGDMSQFYFHIASPFAYRDKGKIYLRFMQVPEAGNPNDPDYYDATQLLVCTYLWKNRDFSLVGPSTCIGSHQ
ncbi:MAG: hypothetical protein ACK4PR_10670, partial [Gammaproteobacteria bacterium]